MAAARKRIEPDETVPLQLSQAERKLLLEGCMLPPELEGKIKICLVKGKRLVAMLTLDEVEELQGCVAAEANHTEDRKYQAAMDRICERAETLLDRHTDQEGD